jgi:hypothetical protein
MKKLFYVVLAVSGLLLSGCDLKEKYQRTVEVPLTISGGQKLVVHTDVGSITVADSNAPQGLVKAVITGKGDTIEKAQKVAEAINITAENNADGVIIKINKPAEIKNDWFAVDYTINTRQDISLDAKTDVGSINVSNIKGDIAASCDVGSITCENAGGKLKLNADVGNISAAFAEDAGSGVIADLSVDVGNIHFKCPKNLSAGIDASTDVGSISSDLPITVQGNVCSKKLNGTIGSGEGSIRLKTDVGSIKIK